MVYSCSGLHDAALNWRQVLQISPQFLPGATGELVKVSPRRGKEPPDYDCRALGKRGWKVGEKFPSSVTRAESSSFKRCHWERTCTGPLFPVIDGFGRSLAGGKALPRRSCPASSPAGRSWRLSLTAERSAPPGPGATRRLSSLEATGTWGGPAGALARSEECEARSRRSERQRRYGGTVGTEGTDELRGKFRR